MLASRNRQLKKKMESSADYDDWLSLAEKHDFHTGASKWRAEDADHRYNHFRIRRRYQTLKELRDAEDHREMLFHLNEGIHGNLDGMGRPSLYTESLLGTKKLIEDYVNLICECLKIIAAVPDTVIGFDEKLDFFRRASHCYGRSALTLSGAAGMTYFHHGVVRALVENKLLPKVMSGASGGAWMCCQMADKSDEELGEYFLHQRYQLTDNAANAMSLLEVVGQLTDNIGVRTARVHDLVDSFVSDLTFQEAFEKTGRLINVSVAPSEQHQNSRLLNVITSPNVTLSSAAKATAAIPKLLEPVQLYAKNYKGEVVKYLPGRKWVDGSVFDDLPFKRLSRLYGVNHFIVSMANPIIVPFLAKEPRLREESVTQFVRTAFGDLLKHIAKSGIPLMKKIPSPLKLKNAGMLGAVFNNVLAQDYHGDVNIVLGNSHNTLKRFFFSYESDDDVKSMILTGERAAWPKIAQIKNSMAISKTLEGILANLDREAVENSHDTTKQFHVL